MDTKIEHLILENRSYRRYVQYESIPISTLKYFIEYSGKVPSARNLQPLRYVISNDFFMNNEIFNCLTWASYLPSWNGPDEGEQPAAYIVVCADVSVKAVTNMTWCDAGIASQTLLLLAVSKKYAGCILASFSNDLVNILDLKPNYEPLIVIAHGRPNEKITLKEVDSDGSIRYFRDQNSIHYVPKRKLEDVIIKTFEHIQ